MLALYQLFKNYSAIAQSVEQLAVNTLYVRQKNIL